MKASVEHLHHFNCDRCGKWWAIGDFPWGSQKTMWCPWCGHENKLPEAPLTAKDFAAKTQPEDPEPFNFEDWLALRKRRATDEKPKSGQIYRHRDHDPKNDKWHEYEIVCVTEKNQKCKQIQLCLSVLHTTLKAVSPIR